MLKQWTNEEGSIEIRSLVVIQVGFIRSEYAHDLSIEKENTGPQI